MSKLIGILLAGLFSAISSFISATPTPAPMSIAPVETMSPSPIPTMMPTKVNKATIDPDPIIDCVSSSPNCSGSSIKGRRSQCSLITCCQIGNNWSVYSTSQKCKDAQNSYYQTNTYIPTNNYVYPSVAPYTPSPYSICLDSAQKDLKNCEEKCNNSYPSDGSNYLYYQGLCTQDCFRSYSSRTGSCPQ